MSEAQNGSIPNDKWVIQIAAGTICWRQRDDAEVEILTISRHGYGGVSFPKGKREPGESLHLTAFRETLEETNVTVRLGQFIGESSYSFLGSADYPNRSGHAMRNANTRQGRKQLIKKQVHYWAAKPRVIEKFLSNDEVQKIHWIKASDIKRAQLHKSDMEIANKFLDLYKRRAELFHGKTVILLRHAHTHGEDALSPLGMQRSQTLPVELSPWAPEKIYCSPKQRCIQTVHPLSKTGIDVLNDPALGGESGDNILENIREYPGECILICTHAPLIASTLSALGVEQTNIAPGEYRVVTLLGQSGPGGARTHDQRIKSPMLFQLSYRPHGEPRFSKKACTRDTGDKD